MSMVLAAKYGVSIAYALLISKKYLRSFCAAFIENRNAETRLPHSFLARGADPVIFTCFLIYISSRNIEMNIKNDL